LAVQAKKAQQAKIKEGERCLRKSPPGFLTRCFLAGNMETRFISKQGQNEEKWSPVLRAA